MTTGMLSCTHSGLCYLCGLSEHFACADVTELHLLMCQPLLNIAKQFIITIRAAHIIMLYLSLPNSKPRSASAASR